MLETVVGIPLKSSPFQENNLLVSMLTKEHGLITLFLNSPKQTLLPFSTVECVLSKGKSDLYYVREAKLLHPSPQAPTWEVATACTTMRELLLSLPEATRDARVFLLLAAIVQHLHLASKPQLLATAFCLKVIAHEGLITDERKCPQCSGEGLHFADGEFSCSKHAAQWAIAFTKEEAELMDVMLNSRNLAEIDSLAAEAPLLLKLQMLAKGGT